MVPKMLSSSVKVLAATFCITAATASTHPECVLTAEGDCQENSVASQGNSTEIKGFILKENTSILDVMNPDILKDEDLLHELRRHLQNHELVVLRDAFVPEFADYVWEELNRDDLEWEATEEISPDGFSLSHSNFYWNDTWTNVMFETHAVFDHPDSVEWIANLTGRRLTNEKPHYAAPSRFFTGDFSMPHSDYAQERSVSYVWHLSRDWNPAWGGAFYWTPEPENHHAYVHASYNTLALFSVTRLSQHMVTTVTSELPEPEYKRLAWNGWWLDLNEYDYTDPVEDLFDTYEKRLEMTDRQVGMLLQDNNIEEQVDNPDRVKKLQEWRETLISELEGGPRVNSFVVDLYGSAEQDRARWAAELQAQEEDNDEDEDWEYDEEEVEDDPTTGIDQHFYRQEYTENSHVEDN